MGTGLIVRIRAGDRATAGHAAEAVIRAVERTDNLLSTWRADTELARLNRGPVDHPVSLSPPALALLREAKALTEATGEAFDPTVGALVGVWDLRGLGRLPDSARLAAARHASGWERFILGPASVVRTHPDAWIDPGAFGKGAALRAAVVALKAEGIDHALLNLGGQVVVLTPTDRPPWWITIADPASRTDSIAAVALRSGSVATSGQSERMLHVGGRRIGHILDPRSGEPVPAWGSVTVVDPDPLRADALATALFVLGSDSGWAWAERHHVAALFVICGASGPVLRPTPALRAGSIAAFHERTGG